jgi:hypothetical protein
MPAPLVLVDAALRGMVVALLLLAAGLMLRDRPRLPAAQAGALLTVGLIVQVFSSTPSFEQRVRVFGNRPGRHTRWPIRAVCCSCVPL